MGVLKGFNGFPDIETFEFYNTGQYLTIGNQKAELFKCVGIGTSVNVWNWIQAHLNLVGNIDHTNRNTWVKIFEGVYLSELEVYTVSGDTAYTFKMNFENVTVQYFENGEVVERSYDYTNDNYISWRVMNTWYQSPPELTITHINYHFMPPNQTDVFGVNSYYFIGNVGGMLIASSAGYLNQQSTVRINDPEYPTTEGTADRPVLSPSYWNLSGDDSKTWYVFGDYGSHSALMSFGGEIETNQESDTSEPDGGGGNYDYEPSETVPSDGVPTISAVSSGFVKIYHPSIQNLLDFRDYLYSNNFIDNVKKLLDNPLNYIISLMLNACIPTDGTSQYIGAGGVASEVSAPVVSSQYKFVDCGSVNIEECYGGFLDYDNFTQVKVYLPFCGELSLDTNIVMHSTLYLKYAVDFLTGDCVARLEVRNNHGVQAEFYFKDGNCACQVPMSGENYASFFTQGVRALLGAGATLGGNPSGLVQTADAVASMHVERQRVGGISGDHGFLGNYTPYVTIERPAQSFPYRNNELKGRPSNIGGTVGSFSGYTEIEYVKLDGIQATDAELEEIKQLLADGVYI